jgi:hypothetical protein
VQELTDKQQPPLIEWGPCPSALIDHVPRWQGAEPMPRQTHDVSRSCAGQLAWLAGAMHDPALQDLRGPRSPGPRCRGGVARAMTGT